MPRNPDRAALGLALLLGAALGSGACKRGADESARPAPSAAATVAHRPPGPWFSGTIEQAFTRARAERRTVFLYWGAAWCPPCNELSSEVFSKPRFAELMAGFVPVYLDGDTEEAQRSGEALGVSAYPTMLVLSPEREELLRVNGSVDLRELEEALGAVVGRGESFAAAVKRLEEGALAAEDCRALALAAWELLPEKEWAMPRVLATLQRATDRCPAEMHRERAILASSLLGLAVTNRSTAGMEGAVGEVAARAPALLDIIFADDEAAWASRAFVNHRAADMAAWLHPGAAGEGYERLKARWLGAASSIRGRAEASVDVRLWTVGPALDFHRHERPEGPVPEALRAEVLAAVRLADERARSAYERHAAISGAAYLLRRVGANDEARRMLIAEAERSDTPFYYHSSLSALEGELGRTEEARAWSEKARKSAAGRATRLQWIANDILLNAKLEGQRGYLLALAGEFYELATSLGDGFSGRNRTRADQVARALGPLRGDPELGRIVARYRQRCERMPEEAKKSCRAYFEDVLSSARPLDVAPRP
ncbi:thioredoxin family protein [Polyangium aurulentum]|uniref:thioredoxin family protein n=1 Tax=Polyangium aurulentum TaxID=2567896 RepID=UPI0010AEA0D5|nr:thioredoxin family protein [Polyangium aurulentum]UQA55258.1 thioredoxin family protein [Polyangium aurulentum]